VKASKEAFAGPSPKIQHKGSIMSKIIININGHIGRPSGATEANTKIRNAMIIKAFHKGFRRKVIANMLGLSYATVCKALKGVEDA
jgi:DNA-binding NarL/FixJ family response regulator